MFELSRRLKLRTVWMAITSSITWDKHIKSVHGYSCFGCFHLSPFSWATTASIGCHIQDFLRGVWTLGASATKKETQNTYARQKVGQQWYDMTIVTWKLHSFMKGFSRAWLHEHMYAKKSDGHVNVLRDPGCPMFDRSGSCGHVLQHHVSYVCFLFPPPFPFAFALALFGPKSPVLLLLLLQKVGNPTIHWYHPYSTESSLPNWSSFEVLLSVSVQHQQQGGCSGRAGLGFGAAFTADCFALVLGFSGTWATLGSAAAAGAAFAFADLRFLPSVFSGMSAGTCSSKVSCCAGMAFALALADDDTIDEPFEAGLAVLSNSVGVVLEARLILSSGVRCLALRSWASLTSFRFIRSWESSSGSKVIDDDERPAQWMAL